MTHRNNIPRRIRAAVGENPKHARRVNVRALGQFVQGDSDLVRLEGALIPTPGTEFCLLRTTGDVVIIFDTDFSGINLRGLDVTEGLKRANNCKEVQFVRCRFAGARFVASDIRVITLFKECDMTGASFKDATAHSVIFDGCVMTGVTFDNIYVDRLEIIKTDVSGTSWTKASAIVAIFTQVSGWSKTRSEGVSNLPPMIVEYIEMMCRYERYCEGEDGPDLTFAPTND